MSWFDDIKENAVDVEDLPASNAVNSEFKQDPYLGNLTRTALQGLSAGFGDEGEAMLRALYMAGVEGKDYSEAYEEALSDARKNIEAFRETNPISAYGSEIGASLIGAGKLKSIPALMGYGGLYGYGASEGDLISEERLIDAGQSAALTGVGAKALQSVAPKVSEAAQALYNRGIRLTPGQMMGGATKRIEQAASSTPITGAAVDRARTDAIEDFNRVVINDALKSIGKQVPDDVAGREAFKAADDILGKEYNKVLAPIRLSKTAELDDVLKNIVGNYTPELGEAGAKRLQAIIEKNVTSRFKEAGKISGKVFKEIDSTLGAEIRKMRASIDYDINKLGDALQDVKNGLFEQVAKQNKNADAIRAVDTAYRRMIPVERAVEKVGGSGEIFTPAQLLTGVKQASPRVRGGRRKFARGEAEMQELAEQGKEVLGGLPDSGTARNILNNPLTALAVLEGIGAGGVPIGTLSAIPTVGTAYSRTGVPLVRQGLLGLRRRLPQSTPVLPATSGILFGD